MSRDHIITAPNGKHISYTVSISTVQSQTPLLLFIHFWGGSATTWTEVMAELSPRHTMLAISLRGWGNSSPSSDAKGYSMSSYADDIVAVLQDKDTLDRVHNAVTNGIVLIGHSMGAKIAQYILSRLQDFQVFNDRPLKMALIAPAPSGRFELEPEMKQTQIHAYDDAQAAEFVVRSVLLAKSDSVNDATVQRIVNDAVRGDALAKAAWPEYGMAEDYESQLVATLGIMNTAVRPAFLVVVGQTDRVETIENVQQRVVTVLQGAGAEVRFEKLSSGHLVPIEEPEALASLIDDFVS